MAVETTLWPDGPITGRWFEEQAGKIAGGEGALKMGQVLAYGHDGKWYKLRKFTGVVGADSAGNRGTLFDVAFAAATKSYNIFLAHAHIQPGSLSIKSAADANNSHVFDDDKMGGLAGVATDKQRGVAHYEAGQAQLYWDSNIEAGNALASYRYGNADGLSYPAGVLQNYEIDASDSTQDVGATIVVMGELRADRLLWPSGIANADKAFALDYFRRHRHIYPI